MYQSILPTARKWAVVFSAAVAGLALLLSIMISIMPKATPAYAEPIDPPEGYPKLTLSMKSVTPTLATADGVVLTYSIEIRNTGAYTAVDATMSDIIPDNTLYNGDAPSSVLFSNNSLNWIGDVGFDETVVISFSVTVTPGYSGNVENTAVISQAQIAQPISMSAVTVITDQPILTIEKRSSPPLPGANQPMVYTLTVTNMGQPAVNVPITVTDQVPLSTTLDLGGIGIDGLASADGRTISWTRNVTLDLWDSTLFTFTVLIDDVLSGTVISNSDYWVESPASGVTAGEPLTITVIDPIFTLSKEILPDPPGSNSEATYILTLFNQGSAASDIVVTDTVPAGVEYVTGGSESGGVVSWTYPALGSFQRAQFTYTVAISDVADVDVVNSDYQVCSGEQVCEAGRVITSVVQGPIFVTTAEVVPIAKKPGGKVPITPTLTAENVGNGNAVDATIELIYERFSLSSGDIAAYFDDGSIQPLALGPGCGAKCERFVWNGDIAFMEKITFTIAPGKGPFSTIGGNEGDELSAMIWVEDTMSNGAVFTGTAQAASKVTHLANVYVVKNAPPVVGAGQLLTYTLNVRNGGFTTDLPPIITDVVPISTTVVEVSNGGDVVSNALPISSTVVSWTLPLLAPGESITRTFTVRVDGDLVSGTQIINSEYAASGYGNYVVSDTLPGPAVTTTVKEVGLIDSFKDVAPKLLRPGAGNVLTYSVHVVNSGPLSLTGVTVFDSFPWKDSTYQRDAEITSGQLVSDIVSFHWTGDVAPFSEEVITFTVLVDGEFSGTISNTAVISHPDLLEPVMPTAVAYVTDDPVLFVSKRAAERVTAGGKLLYDIEIVNLGQQATNLVISDTIPSGSSYFTSSATADGQLVDGEIQWQLSNLGPGEKRSFRFQVTAGSGRELVNDDYRVSSAEGVWAVGLPVITIIDGGTRDVYLPVVIRQ